MPFGRFKGTLIADLGDGYLFWLERQRWLREPVLESVQAEAQRRRRSASDPAPVAAGACPPRAIELVELGFRTAALRHHPDVGGDHQAMVEVLAARAFLLAVVGA